MMEGEEIERKIRYKGTLTLEVYYKGSPDTLTDERNKTQLISELLDLADFADENGWLTPHVKNASIEEWYSSATFTIEDETKIQRKPNV